MFHSRRIGQRPNRFAVPDGETVIERPDATTILGATKVTGKANGWTYGGLTALTDREYALVETADGGERDRAADRALHLLQRRRACRRTCSRLVQHRRPRHGGDARERFRRLHRVGRLLAAMAQNKYTWNGQWSGTRAPINGVMKTGFGGVTNFNYNSKHFGVFGALRLLQQTRSRTPTSASFSAATTRRRCLGGFNFAQPDPTEVVPAAQRVHEHFTELQRRLAAARRAVFHRRRGPVPELLEHVHRRRPVPRRPTTISTRAAGRRSSSPAAGSFDSFIGTDSRKRIRVSADGNFFGNAKAGTTAASTST